jgi:hypothetical protein
MKKLSVLVFAFLMLAQAEAQVITGDDLHDYSLAYLKGETSEYPEAVKAGKYMGYITGLRECLSLSRRACRQTPLMCSQEEITQKQAFDVVAKYLEKNPAKRLEPAMLLVSNALQEAFPCEE